MVSTSSLKNPYSQTSTLTAKCFSCHSIVYLTHTKPNKIDNSLFILNKYPEKPPIVLFMSKQKS